MLSIPKSLDLIELDDDAKRQYIDATTVFQAWEEAQKATGEVRGGMYWKRAGTTEYLIRTSPTNAQKSLGPRSAETEAIYERFFARKGAAEARESELRTVLERHRRMNRALQVGRVPAIVVDILNTIAQAGLSQYFTVVGTHALYAYEAAVGVRIIDSSAMETRDVDLLWDTRKRVQFISDMNVLGTSMVGILKKIDPTFEIRQDQKYTATNSKGFEVDIIRREAIDGDPHPIRLSDADDDFWVTQARRAGALLNAPRFSAVIVSTSGQMARMNTISPVVFGKFKRWMAEQPDREPLKRTRDVRQAEVVESLIEEYLPHLKTEQTAKAPNPLSVAWKALPARQAHSGAIEAVSDQEVIQHIGQGRYVAWDRQKLHGATPEVGRIMDIAADGKVADAPSRDTGLSR